METSAIQATGMFMVVAEGCGGNEELSNKLKQIREEQNKKMEEWKHNNQIYRLC